jgi:hypothetical protein
MARVSFHGRAYGAWPATIRVGERKKWVFLCTGLGVWDTRSGAIITNTAS